MALIMNEKIKASEVQLLDLDGNSLGEMATKEALKLANEKVADLVCTNIMQSPPLCQLVARGKAKSVLKQGDQAPKKSKEIRLTPNIEQHDYDTKLNQCEKLLSSGHPVDLVIKLSGKQGELAKKLLQQIIDDLKAIGKPATGIQLSGKQAAVTLQPLIK